MGTGTGTRTNTDTSTDTDTGMDTDTAAGQSDPWVREPPQDGHDTVEQRVRVLDLLAADVAPSACDLESAARFGGAAGSDAVMLKAVAAQPLRSLGHVKWHRRGCAAQLIGQVAVVPCERECRRSVPARAPPSRPEQQPGLSR